MSKTGINRTKMNNRQIKLKGALEELSQRISHYSISDFPRIEFLKKISKMLRDVAMCDEIELCLLNRDKEYGSERVRHTKRDFFFEACSIDIDKTRKIIPYSDNDTDFERLCKKVLNADFDPASSFFTAKGTFRVGDLGDYLSFGETNKKQTCFHTFPVSDNIKSLVIIPLITDNERIGLFQLKDRKKYCFIEHEITLYENFSQTLGISLLNQRTQAALRERVKELTCMYGIAQAAKPDVSIHDIMHNTVELLPQAWQYPQNAYCRIILDGYVYTSRGFRDGQYAQKADIVVNAEKRGIVEIVYTEKKTKIDEGPFLKEERNLIDNVAKALSLIIEQKQSQEDKIRLQKQIRHADRLATIGQLAAGVAHELNEPLGNILGFAQLITKNTGLPEQIEKDIEKIINASLHAREIVRKLLIFARQMPIKKSKVSLNTIIEEGLYFLESRCAKDGVTLIRRLDKRLPAIIADAAQITQVLVNLVVNAIQAMSRGGTIKVQTLTRENYVFLIIEDTGEGMNEKIMKQIFLPFFTTKEVGQGTGLGLAVVHGIVTSHGGSIKVESEVGRGTRFEIRFPAVKPEF